MYSFLKKLLNKDYVYILSLLILEFAVFHHTINSFFVADDFTWLKWAATSSITDLPSYFLNSQNFFYRPLDKTVVFLLYSLFKFQAVWYHIFTLLVHFFISIAAFYLFKKIIVNKFLTWAAVLFFLLNPSFAENIYWFSTFSISLSTLFIILSLLAFHNFRDKKSRIAYFLTNLLIVLAFLSYEQAVISPLLLIIMDRFIFNVKNIKQLIIDHLSFLILIPLYALVRFLTHAFSGGGDYSYNLTNFFPNVIGNIFGYIMLLFGGEFSLSLYNSFRVYFKSSKLLFFVIFLSFLIVIIFLIKKNNKTIYKLIYSKNYKLILFGLFFGLISLLPYLPLGNIAPRYLYLGSLGFALSFIILINLIYKKYFSSKFQKYLFFFVGISIYTYFIFGIYSSYSQWQKAANITLQTFLFIKKDYSHLDNKSTLLFINVPIKYNNAWVYPVGLEDSLYFIYGKKMPQIFILNSLTEARVKFKNTKNVNTLIFLANGDINKIKL